MIGPSGAGDLRDRVRFQRRLPADDGYGNAVADWADIFEPRWCQLTPTRGREEIVAMRAQGKVQFDCWVRCDPDTAGLTTDDRVVDVFRPERSFNIVMAADMDGRGRWILLQLEQGGADG